MEERSTTITHTSPAWRVAAVVLTAGAVAAVGFWLQAVGHADDFATIMVITVAFSVSFWADKRPDRLAIAVGPFGKIATAVRESQADIRAWVYRRPMRVGVGLALLYGVAVVLAKALIVAVLAAVYSWQLAVALGCAVGALVSAPELFRGVARKALGPPVPSPGTRSGGSAQLPHEAGEGPRVSDHDGPDGRAD